MENCRQPFWFDDALARECESAAGQSILPKQADVVIVGGGFTGLWTAIKIKQKSPQTDVCVIEQGLCGQGASGRNGGAMLTWSTKFTTLAKYYGVEAAKQLVEVSERAVTGIEQFCIKHGIDADIRVDGAYYTATNRSQLGLLSPVIKQLKVHNINHWQAVDNDTLAKQTGSLIHLEGLYSKRAGSLHPGKLVRGLLSVVRKLGVTVVEQCAMQSLDGGIEVSTALGKIKTKRVVMATNSWMAKQFSEFSRAIVLVSSDMVITKPIPQTVEALGLDHGASVIDLRTFVHYYRTTPDGRIMLGKGGNNFSFANKMRPMFNAPSDYKTQLSDTLQRFFPGHELPIERSWNGASDRSATGFPFFGEMANRPGVFYGLGYSGNGVVQTFIGGEILSSLVLDMDDAWANCALVTGCGKKFPPEPLRYTGAIVVRDAIRRKELREDLGLQPRWWDARLAKLADFAGKTDSG